MSVNQPRCSVLHCDLRLLLSPCRLGLNAILASTGRQETLVWGLGISRLAGWQAWQISHGTVTTCPGMFTSHRLPMGTRTYRPMAFADAVLTHDVQDAHANGVSIPTASGQACQAHAGKHPALLAASCAGLQSTRTVYGAASGKRKP